MDIYFPALSPGGVIYSFIPSGTTAKDIRPYGRKFSNPDRCTCENVFTYTICSNPPPGTWTVAIAAVPSGAPAEPRYVLTYSLQKIVISR